MKIFILGAGHMGIWLYRELSKTNNVAIWDKIKSTRDKFGKESNFISGSRLKTFNPDLFINAVDLKNTKEGFREVLPHLNPNCIISDISTIKGDLEEFYQESGFRFVSVHPMFGPHFANLNQLENSNAIIISESDEKGKSFFRSFFEKLKLKIFEHSFKEHDELMSVSLTLPFSASIAFAACSEDFTVPGTTYAKHHEIAKKLFLEDDFLLSEVLFNPGSIKQIERVVTKLEHLKHIIRAGDHEEAILFYQDLRTKLNKFEKK